MAKEVVAMIRRPAKEAARALARNVEDLATGRRTADDLLARDTGPARGRITDRDAARALTTLETYVRNAVDGTIPVRQVLRAAEFLRLSLRPDMDPALLALVAQYVGVLECISGDNALGARHFERAAEYARRAGDDELLCGVVGDLANAYRNQGLLADAREAYHHALMIARGSGLRDFQVRHLANLAIVYGDLGDGASEMETLLEARAIAQGAGLKDQLAEVLLNLGGALLRGGDVHGALNCFHQTNEIEEAAGRIRLLGKVFGNLAQCYVHLGNRTEARVYYQRSLAVAEQREDRSGQIHCLGNMGLLAIEDGDSAAGEALLERAADLARRHAIPNRLLVALRALARQKIERGQRDAADALLQEAAEVGEYLRADVKHAHEARGLQEHLAGAYEALVELAVDRGDAVRALEFSERGRAALLLRRMVETGQQKSSDSLGGRPLCFEDVGRQLSALSERAVLVAYFHVGDRMLIFVVRSGDPVIVEERAATSEDLLAIKADLEREVARFPDFGDIGETWLRLSALVIQPLLPHLRDGDVLLIAPHGLLHGIPLHALQAGHRRVVERWPVAYLPALSALPRLRSRAGAPQKPVILGSHFAEEAEVVACLLGVSACSAINKDALLERMAAADLVHLSCYGFFLPHDPAFSGLVLEPGKELDAYLRVRARPPELRSQANARALRDADGWAGQRVLTAGDLVGRQLSADVVTLSACESGLFAIAPGDEAIGLVPALLESGVRCVIGTNWLVDSVSTKTFMTAFYRELQAAEGWAGAADAVQTAMLRVMRRHSHPYHWAPFTMVGGAPALVGGA